MKKIALVVAGCALGTVIWSQTNGPGRMNVPAPQHIHGVMWDGTHFTVIVDEHTVLPFIVDTNSKIIVRGVPTVKQDGPDTNFFRITAPLP